MFQFTSFFRGSKTTNKESSGNNITAIPKSLEINVNAVEDEDGFMEITTRRKTYLEVAKEAFYGQSSQSNIRKDGTTPILSIVTKKKTKSLKPSKQIDDEDELSYSANLDDLDGVNYDLKKSNRHVLKLKNKKTPSYYKDLKSKKAPSKKMAGSNKVIDQLS